MALPLSILPKLYTTRSRKLALAGVFSVGFIIIVFAILRLVKTRPNNTHVNPKWLCIFSVTEASVAVMVSCAPALRSLFAENGQHVRTWSSSKNKSSSSRSEVGERSPSTIPLQVPSQNASQKSDEMLEETEMQDV